MPVPFHYWIFRSAGQSACGGDGRRDSGAEPCRQRTRSLRGVLEQLGNKARQIYHQLSGQGALQKSPPSLERVRPAGSQCRVLMDDVSTREELREFFKAVV